MVKRGVVIGGVLALVSGIFVSNAFAEEQNLDFSITVQNASIQLTVPETVNLDLTPTSAAADFKFANLTIKVGTNNATGYTLTMSVPSTDISRVGAVSGDSVIGTLGSQEGGYSQNDFTANKWGYKITGDNYFPITTTLSPSQWITDGPANNVDNIITLASKVNTAIPAGTYNTTLTFSAVANPGLDDTAFNIVYNSNGGTGKMSPTTIEFGQVGTVSDSTFTPPAGMKFDGWASSSAGAGPYIAGGVSYVAPASSAGGTVKILYAMWVPSETPSYVDPTPDQTGTTLTRAYEIAYTAAHKGMYEEDTPGSNTFSYVDSWNGGQYQGEGRDVRFLLQDMTPDICASATVIGSEALVLDIRDQTSYHIVKAADGRCWMQDDLVLDLTNANTQANMDSTNTNAPDAAITNLFNDNDPQITGWSTPKVRATTSLDLWHVLPEIVTTYVGAISSDQSGTSWKTGIMYNYCAISSGTYCYNGGNPDLPDTLIDSPYDICPFGWRLPTGDSLSGEYGALETSYYQAGTSSSTRVKQALHLTGSGYYNYSDLYHEGSVNYWSATYYGGAQMMDYYYWGYQTNSNAITVRCISK